MHGKTLSTFEDLQKEAADFVSTLSSQESGATLITLSGELGAGKTSFVQGVAHVLGVKERVTSPTFVLEKVYELLPEHARGFTRLVHIDAYRLEGSVALTPLGFADIMRNPSHLVLIEWPERVKEALPVPYCAITLSLTPDNTRLISYDHA